MKRTFVFIMLSIAILTAASCSGDEATEKTIYFHIIETTTTTTVVDTTTKSACAIEGDANYAKLVEWTSVNTDDTDLSGFAARMIEHDKLFREMRDWVSRCKHNYPDGALDEFERTISP